MYTYFEIRVEAIVSSLVCNVNKNLLMQMFSLKLFFREKRHLYMHCNTHKNINLNLRIQKYKTISTNFQYIKTENLLYIENCRSTIRIENIIK